MAFINTGMAEVLFTPTRRSRLRSAAAVAGLVAWVICAALTAMSCQRSPQFKKDQEIAAPDTPGIPASYYSAPGAKGASPTSRIEAMGQPKKRVLILDFWNDTPVRQGDLERFAADELRRSLSLTNRVILPAEARTELTTHDFVQGERIRVSQLIREGRRLGVAVIGVGRISKIVFRQRGDDVGLLRQRQSLAAVDLEMKIFDVSSGREVMAIGKSGESGATAMVAFEGNQLESPQFRAELTKAAAKNAAQYLVPDVLRSIEKMAWEGRIAKLTSGKIYINAGRNSGLVGGDILRVMTPGDDIYDPATGAYLGRSQGSLKGTLEVVDFVGGDGAVAEVHTGANFQEGDTVQLY